MSASIQTPLADDHESDVDSRTPPIAAWRARLDAISSSSRQSRWTMPVALAVAPIVVLVVLRTSPYFGLNNGDPFVYAGYSNDFVGHVRRFGYTYHSVRFGLIFPLRAFNVLGIEAGYFVLRYVLYVTATVPIYLALRPWSRRAGALAALVFIANPVSAQAILTTHPDTIVVPLVAAVSGLMVIVVRHTSLRTVAAIATLGGLAAGVSLNANIFSGPLMVIAVLTAAAVFVVRRRLAAAAVLCGCYLAATLAVCAAGAAVYSHYFGDWNIFRTTVNAVTDISGDAMWQSSYLGWLENRWFVYAPIVALGWCLLSWWPTRRLRDRNTASAWVIVGLGTACIAYYLVYQFLLDGSSMETSYYYSYVIGIAALLVGAGEAFTARHRETSRPWIQFVSIVALAFLSQVHAIGPLVVLIVVSVVLCCVAFRLRRSDIAVLCVFAVMSACWNAAPRQITYPSNAGFQYEPHYERTFGDADRTAYDAFQIASQLPLVVPSDPNRVVPMLFWYRSFDAVLDSIQASYHWETSAVQRRPSAGMPEISEDDMTRLRALTGGFLVIISDHAGEAEAGIASLVERGFSLGAIAPPTEIRSGSIAVSVTVVPIVAVP